MTPKPRRVTSEDTRDRVRNNPLRHRARRKEYIATLEDKLHEAERTISALRSQIHDLKEALGRINSKRISTTLTSEPKGLDIQGSTSRC
jgi:septal ring factor EnvC (AmiA/AmiB activator)